jgi:hypothetical protein
MRKEITFVKNFYNVGEDYNPKPASSCIPDWYKKAESYRGNEKTVNSDASVNATIKKCVPVFDSITSGYIIFLPIDIFVNFENNEQAYFWPTGYLSSNESVTNPILIHGNWQAKDHPLSEGDLGIPKFMNPWSIQTPKGYSVLITQPKHRDLPFEILSAIVDTDKYCAPINFPFVLKDLDWQGIIPAGTPIAQIIPFKRNDWEMKISDKEKDRNKMFETMWTIRGFFYDGYRNNSWTKKKYK